MDLDMRLDAIHTKDDLAGFVAELKADLLRNPEDWENPDLPSYLEAMTAWIQSMEAFYQNAGRGFPDPPSWKTFAEILLAARIYE